MCLHTVGAVATTSRINKATVTITADMATVVSNCYRLLVVCYSATTSIISHSSHGSSHCSSHGSLAVVVDKKVVVVVVVVTVAAVV